jgi:hypothetical protein
MKKEDLIYKDEDYEIYKKYAGELGTIMEQEDIAMIGIRGLASIRHHFKFEDDYYGLIDKMIEELEKLKLQKDDD